MTERPRAPGFAKSPPELVTRFDSVVERLVGVEDGLERRKMFGYPALFVGGNLVTGLHQSSWMIRLPDDARTVLLAVPGASNFEPMAGRPMRGYATLPPAIVDDDAQLETWVRRAIAFARTLPAKR